MDAFESRVTRSVKETLDTRISDLKSRLVNTPAEDYAGYKQRVGHIAGLSDALTVIREAEKTFSRAEIVEEIAPEKARRYEE